MFPPVAAISDARLAIAPGVIFSARAITWINPVFWAMDSVDSLEKEVAISTLSFKAHSFKSASTAAAWAGSRSIKTVSIKRDLMTTCSMSNTVMENGSKVEKRAEDIPGASMPDSKIRPV